MRTRAAVLSAPQTAFVVDYLSVREADAETVSLRTTIEGFQRSLQITQNRYFTHGNLKIDFARAEVWKENKPVFLSATEYRLLIQFAHHIGQVMTAEELLMAIWGPQYREDKEILWVSIARLRQKLEDNPHSPVHIVTRA